MTPNELPKVVIFRHATRAMTDLEDPSLNAQGLAQAERLVHLIHPKGPLPVPTAIWTSPKLRARQTMMAVADRLSIQPEVRADLDERTSAEDRAQFRSRIHNCISVLEARVKAQTCFYVCSHFDWLEDAMQMLPSDMSDLDIAMPFGTAEYRIFAIEDGVWKLVGRGRAE